MNNHLAITAITCLLAWMLTACSGEELSSPSAATGGPCTYTLRLEGSCQGFDDATRAAVVWQDGDVVYLRFTDDAGQVDGTATYKQVTKEWTIVTKREIISEGGSCISFYFDNPVQVTSQKVTLSPASVVYADSLASYQLLIEDRLMVIKAAMKPHTGRICFKGTSGQSCEVWGMSYHQSFSLKLRTFTDADLKVETVVSENGYTDYYHAFLAADQAILCGNSETSCFSGHLWLRIPGTRQKRLYHPAHPGRP